jgi:maleate cis-trans isomerase
VNITCRICYVHLCKNTNIEYLPSVHKAIAINRIKLTTDYTVSIGRNFQVFFHFSGLDICEDIDICLDIEGIDI